VLCRRIGLPIIAKAVRAEERCERLGVIREANPPGEVRVVMTTPKTTAPTRRPVRVFISYSHDPQEHSARVLGLTQRLRREGVDAIIDQFFPFPAEGWIRWMEQQVDAADFVLCVCTENYRISFDGLRQGPSGKGVNWEGQTISVCIYEAGGKNSRFIPVIFAEDGPSAIPRALKPYTYFVLDRQYDELYFLLTSQPAVSPETLGPVRVRPEPLGSVEVISPGIPSTALPLDMATSIERQIQVIAAGPGKAAEAALEQLEQMARSPEGNILVETIIRQLISYISALEASTTYPRDERLLRKKVVRTLIRLTDGKLSTYLPDRALSRIDLALFDFRGTDMAGVNFAGSFMIECDFRGVDLSRSTFAACHIRNVRFDGAFLDAVDFSGADWFNALGLNAPQLSASQTSTLMRSPATEAEMLAFLDRSYAIPFSSWGWRVQQELRQTWATYLQPGGLAGEVALWAEPARPGTGTEPADPLARVCEAVRQLQRQSELLRTYRPITRAPRVFLVYTFFPRITASLKELDCVNSAKWPHTCWAMEFSELRGQAKEKLALTEASMDDEPWYQITALLSVLERLREKAAEECPQLRDG